MLGAVKGNAFGNAFRSAAEEIGADYFHDMSPGLKSILSFAVPDQRSGKYLYPEQYEELSSNLLEFYTTSTLRWKNGLATKADMSSKQMKDSKQIKKQNNRAKKIRGVKILDTNPQMYSFTCCPMSVQHKDQASSHILILGGCH
ncbi:hypothetical protein GUJ93_ZPchr0011g27562 [Zizania palustris]|uniref:Uncharacterized protein n=1 Tax=Zizania palustris TaxID=103762 RepID=A0A8J5WME0_ZIZPA|nr:hypothetical protein GUJ93_ZPchr0011g27562 [Zizania palustris]